MSTEPDRPSEQCLECAAPMGPTDRFCPRCGADVLGLEGPKIGGRSAPAQLRRPAKPDPLIPTATGIVLVLMGVAAMGALVWFLLWVLDEIIFSGPWL